MENKDKNAQHVNDNHPEPTEDIQLDIETVTPETEDMKPLDSEPSEERSDQAEPDTENT